MVDEGRFQTGQQIRVLLHVHLVLGRLRITPGEEVPDVFLGERGEGTGRLGGRIDEHVAVVQTHSPDVVASFAVEEHCHGHSASIGSRAEPSHAPTSVGATPRVDPWCGQSPDFRRIPASEHLGEAFTVGLLQPLHTGFGVVRPDWVRAPTAAEHSTP